MTDDLRDLGEFDLIRRLTSRGPADGRGVELGVGDDCAVLDVGGDEHQLVTTDLMTEGVHFLRSADPAAIGDKLMSVNLSDVAAMGGRPAHAVLAMAVPADVSPTYLDRLYEGLYARATRHGVSLVGGDTTASAGPLTLSLTLTGFAPPDRVLRRDAARPGDRVLVSGTLGDSAAGLALLLAAEDVALDADVSDPLLQRHLRPEPRVDLGRALAGVEGVGAAIDLSDGLASDLAHVCERSGVGARIHLADIPISEPLRRFGELTGSDALALALGGGEDYELCVTVRAEAVPGARAAAEGAGVPLTDVGEIVEEPGVVWVDPDGMEIASSPDGYDHFA